MRLSEILELDFPINDSKIFEPINENDFPEINTESSMNQELELLNSKQAISESLFNEFESPYDKPKEFNNNVSTIECSFFNSDINQNKAYPHEIKIWQTQVDETCELTSTKNHKPADADYKPSTKEINEINELGLATNLSKGALKVGQVVHFYFLAFESKVCHCLYFEFSLILAVCMTKSFLIVLGSHF